MKRSLAVAAVLLFAAALLSLIAGCGDGVTAEAKEYMQEGDRIVSELEAETDDLMAEMSEIFYQVSDMESFMDAVDEVKSTTADLRDRAEEAMAAYEKIEALEGVEDYKDYAFNRIGSAFFYQEMLNTIDAFLDEMAAAVEAGTVDEDTLSEIAGSFESQMAELAAELDNTERLAEEIKEEKNL